MTYIDRQIALTTQRHDAGMSSIEKPIADAMDNLDGELIGWVKAAIGMIVTSLTGAVVFLFRHVMTSHAREIQETQTAHTEQLTELRKETNDCREDRKMLRTENVEIRVRLATLEAKVEGSSEPNGTD